MLTQSRLTRKDARIISQLDGAVCQCMFRVPEYICWSAQPESQGRSVRDMQRGSDHPDFLGDPIRSPKISEVQDFL